MSYDIYLRDPVSRATLQAESPHLIRGGTYAAGGDREMHLNVTWNYAPILYRVLGEDGIRSLYNKTGAETIPLLKEAIEKLGDDVSADYWQATEGNVKQALCGLLAFAQLRPDGVWAGD